MEFPPRFMFCINLKKSNKNKKKGSKGNNNATPKEQCRDIVWRVSCSYFNVVTSIEIDRSKFYNVVTSPQHRLQHHSRLQSSNSMSRHQNRELFQCRDINSMLRHQLKQLELQMQCRDIRVDLQYCILNFTALP